MAIEQQFDLSPHGFGNFEVRPANYAGGSCAACHTSQGFIAEVTDGTADFSNGAASMSCYTCHQIHSTYEDADFALTTTDPVTLRVTGTEIDVSGTDNPGSNLCASCHQARSLETYPAYDAAAADSFTITSTHWGIHYGTQANVYQGQLPTEILYGIDPGTTFGSHAGPSCLGCHMGLGEDVGDVGVGGTVEPGGELFHNFTPGEVVCNDCHTNDVTDEGFDHNTVRSDLQTAVTALAECVAAEGVATIHVDAETGVLDEIHPVAETFPETHVAAYLLTATVFNDGSWGAHNPSFTVALVDAARTNMDTNSTNAACDYTP